MEESMKEKVKNDISGFVVGKGIHGDEIIIREGAALPLKEPAKVNIVGTIDAPARWLEKRSGLIPEYSSHVLVDRDKMSVRLQCEEDSFYGTMIEGRLMLSEEYKRFGINSGEYRTHFELAELIKMNRSYFENKSTAMKLVTELQNFKAKVDKEVEQSDNNRGDRRMLISQAVKHNLPEAFSLVFPIFKGEEAQTIQVEVYVNPGDLTCTLVSPEANDIVVSCRDSLINGVIDRINIATPNIVVIEK